MALGKRGGEKQGALWVPSDRLRSPGHPFYDALNRLLASVDFDTQLEKLCEPYYREGGRPGIPPGVYYRMLFVGYFEGLGSQRAIEWRCADSLSLRSYLGLSATERVPDHSSLTRIRQRLPLEIDEAVHRMVLGLAATRDLLEGKTLGVDATLIEACAAMRRIVRREDGRDWKQYVEGLAEQEGVEIKDDEDLRRFDRKRRGKRVSNKDWKSPTDPDARITKMKDGRTRLGFKIQHAVDMESGIVVDASAQTAETADSAGIEAGVRSAQEHLDEAGTGCEVAEVVADKGYHKAEVLAGLADMSVRTYVPERRDARRRRWTDKPAEWKAAVYGNRRRVKGSHGKELQRRRGEMVERSFAHACESGGMRRSTLRGLASVHRRAVVQAVSMNLGTILRAVLGVGTPKRLAELSGALLAAGIGSLRASRAACNALTARIAQLARFTADLVSDAFASSRSRAVWARAA
jgi:transposase